ncbi:MAG: SpoVA protein [Firmicutes bacterium ADurb.Bin506]|nr:MAG: SpoVA protein [Firmicutes bacterium ADurb.Bin506]
MDFKREGYILGMGAKMFIIAGPVIVYGVVSGVIVSAIRWLSR